jgi:hypothetical protein
MGKLTKIQLDRYSKIIQNELDKSLRGKSLVATKDLINSIDGETTENTITITARNYAEFVNEGTKDNPKRGFPNLDKLTRWAKAKDLRPRNAKGQFQKITPKTFNRMVYAIGLSIEKNGIIKRFGGGSKFIDHVIGRVNKNITKDIAEAYLKDISNELKQK